MNQLKLAARLLERGALRYTPAGVAVVEASFQHMSTVLEGGSPRRLEFPFAAIAIGAPALRLSGDALGTDMELIGFLAPRSRRSKRLMVHILEIRAIVAAPDSGTAAI